MATDAVLVRLEPRACTVGQRALLGHAGSVPPPSPLTSRLKRMRVPSTKEVKEQDMYLPKENVKTVMRRMLPPKAQIARDAVECVQECATEFVLFILSE